MHLLQERPLGELILPKFVGIADGKEPISRLVEAGLCRSVEADEAFNDNVGAGATGPEEALAILAGRGPDNHVRPVGMRENLEKGAAKRISQLSSRHYSPRFRFPHINSDRVLVQPFGGP